MYFLLPGLVRDAFEQTGLRPLRGVLGPTKQFPDGCCGLWAVYASRGSHLHKLRPHLAKSRVMVDGAPKNLVKLTLREFDVCALSLFGEFDSEFPGYLAGFMWGWDSDVDYPVENTDNSEYYLEGVSHGRRSRRSLIS